MNCITRCVQVSLLLLPAILRGEEAVSESKLWEPWVDSATVGDKVVRHYPGFDYREILEVTAVDEKSVTVSVKNVYNKKTRPDLKDESRRLIYSRKKYEALVQFHEAARSTGKETVRVKSRDLVCTILERGFIMGHNLVNDRLSICSMLRGRVWINAEVPLGGIVKKFIEGGSPFGRKKSEKDGNLALEFVVEDFSHGSGETLAKKNPAKVDATK